VRRFRNPANKIRMALQRRKMKMEMASKKTPEICLLLFLMNSL
jgi:hypothetical protein